MRSIWILIFVLVVAGCQTHSQEDQLSGRISLWHSWSEEDAVVLEEALDQFEEIHPNVNVVPLALPKDEILEEFNKSAIDGLGPDLLIGESDWIGGLVDAGHLRPIPADAPDRRFYNVRNIDLSSDQNRIFGVPIALEPRALYYNKQLAAVPPTTLDELLQEAETGNRVAFVPRFTQAYWGIQAFGHGLFDAAGTFTPAESGFAKWLQWLDDAQRSPGMILNVDEESLLKLFSSGQVAYYVAGPGAESFLENAEEKIDYGVVPLPGGPFGPAGPLLPAETILLYAYTSPDQTRTANALTEFLVNQQQGIRFMRETNRVPANPAVEVDRRIYPIISGFFRQAQTAVVIPNEIAYGELIDAGDRTYAAVLSGVLTPAEAVCQFSIEVASIQELDDDELSLPAGCEMISEE